MALTLRRQWTKLPLKQKQTFIFPSNKRSSGISSHHNVVLFLKTIWHDVNDSICVVYHNSAWFIQTLCFGLNPSFSFTRSCYQGFFIISFSRLMLLSLVFFALSSFAFSGDFVLSFLVTNGWRLPFRNFYISIQINWIKLRKSIHFCRLWEKSVCCF